jgi:type 1 glutamine amidotransferase
MRGMIGLLALGAAASTLPFASRAQTGKKIVLVSGPKDHGYAGRHEYQKDIAVIKYCLDHSDQEKGITTQIYSGQRVPDAAELKDAAAVVFESSGDRIPRETHAIFPQDATTDHQGYDAATMARLNAVDTLMKQGLGMVSIHYSTWVNNPTGRKFYLDWMGGVAEYPDDTKVKVAGWFAVPLNPTHAIMRGVTPWTYEREEFFTQEYLPEDARRTPLLSVTDPVKGDSSIVSWAVQREGGGRGFMFTGMDFHKNWAIEQHRRMLLNGVVWAARMEVPAGGMSCSIPDELMQ